MARGAHQHRGMTDYRGVMNQTSMRTQSLEYAIEQRNKNPCYKEQKLSMKCLEDNGYDYDKCQHYFDNFKACKGFWLAISKDRLKKNIHPAMPPPEERETIKQEYLKQQAQRRRSSGQPSS
ncbi:coiled-coil-helix-coiled-coil-helix domain-containing protein 7 isoform X1 [Dermacentor silvarum]|uniref:coiled-coil-helix-coiled-coil-helix domain-containing protein 7 isoform X1 n=2 Tax=Dermacentor silvarum TaxID=543639 RepID=UPI002100F803|nr:coiled-coil-helix-coiled-coil-helix domain-containing protein 7 isoform X1 [Dermacentor silvarum]